MATRRTPLKRRARRQITDAAVDAFKLGERHARNGTEAPSEEFLDAFHRLHRALGLRPWESSPLDVDDAEPPAWMFSNKTACDDWRQAYGLRLELEKAARQ